MPEVVYVYVCYKKKIEKYNLGDRHDAMCVIA